MKKKRKPRGINLDTAYSKWWNSPHAPAMCARVRKEVEADGADGPLYHVFRSIYWAGWNDRAKRDNKCSLGKNEPS